MQRIIRAVILVAIVGLASQASADTIAWTDWLRASPGSPGTAYGQIALSGGGSVGVTYAGELSFAQTSGGTNYWIPDTPYLSSVIDNAPPASDIVALNYASVGNTLTFSSSVTNPVMAVVSLGRPLGWTPDYLYYTFDQPWILLSSGQGYWGGDPAGSLSKNGATLVGLEGHGAIQFIGTFDQITWSTTPAENWHGFTVGVPVPEPATLTLLGLGLAGLARVAWRRK